MISAETACRLLRDAGLHLATSDLRYLLFGGAREDLHSAAIAEYIARLERLS